jgi:methylmalonyl-CoA mutase C-terminal domain/subunit
MQDVAVLVGGVIPDEDAAELREMGVDGVFGPDSTTEAIVESAFTAVVDRDN